MFSAFQTRQMFKIRLKFGCSLIYFSAQFKKIVFNIQICATSEQRKFELIRFAVITDGKLCRK